MVMVASIAAGVQFGWALQLSLLTPCVQLLGIPHRWAAYIWLCGPISGMIVQPLVGYYSDSCGSRFGRRHPFIAGGALLVAVAVFLIGYAADLGHVSGDPLGNVAKPRAISVFVVGFWILDVANNTLQGPCRAFLADLSGGNSNKMRIANSAFSFFMAVGNVLGYASGSYTKLYKIFPFSKTTACDVYCANLKSCFFLSIALLLTLTTIALTLIKEPLPQYNNNNNNNNNNDNDGDENDEVVKSSRLCVKAPFVGEMIGALKDLPKPMRALLMVTSLNWMAWFPFLLFDTDWMGKEVYGGVPNVGELYEHGVRAGSLGLMLNSIVLGMTSVLIPLGSKIVGGMKRLWGGVNFILAISLGLTVLVTKLAEQSRQYGAEGLEQPQQGIKAGALALFAVLGIPQAGGRWQANYSVGYKLDPLSRTILTTTITFSIPFALASIFSRQSGAGQGLTLGVLNLAIVIPQMLVSVLSGAWDELLGGGNLPAFIVGAVSAAASGILAFTLLPSPPPDAPTKPIAAAFH
ncbi:hypothetical protein Leryth_014069 [Lithospermum erythrorhizon]|nr:hypothetical protein Leryth_014069 [Lithospermum erythrorhizon]